MARKSVRDLLGMRRKQLREPAPRTSIVAVHDATIRSLLDAAPEIRAPAALERLRAQGYTGGLTVIRQRLRTLRDKPYTEAFLKLDFAPGEIVQVDWADFGFALPGIPRRVSAFVTVMGYSRKLYLEFTLSQSMGSFLRCMERAHQYFGGVTLIDLFDSMTTVVLKHTPRVTVFNPTFVEYARVRHFAVQACTPRKANEKGIVERGIGANRQALQQDDVDGPPSGRPARGESLARRARVRRGRRCSRSLQTRPSWPSLHSLSPLKSRSHATHNLAIRRKDWWTPQSKTRAGDTAWSSTSARASGPTK